MSPPPRDMTDATEHMLMVDIDWDRLASAIEEKIRTEKWRVADVLDHVAVGRTTFYRARAGRPLIWNNVRAICGWLESAPIAFQRTDGGSG